MAAQRSQDRDLSKPFILVRGSLCFASSHFKWPSRTCLAVPLGAPQVWFRVDNQNVWIQFHISSVNFIECPPHELGLYLACLSSDGNILVQMFRPDAHWDTTRIDQARFVEDRRLPLFDAHLQWLAPGALIGPGALEPVHKLDSGGCDNTVKVWKLQNSTWKMDCFPALQMHSDCLRDVEWTPNFGFPKSMMASASQDGTVVIWTMPYEGDQWHLWCAKGH